MCPESGQSPASGQRHVHLGHTCRGSPAWPIILQTARFSTTACTPLRMPAGLPLALNYPSGTKSGTGPNGRRPGRPPVDKHTPRRSRREQPLARPRPAPTAPRPRVRPPSPHPHAASLHAGSRRPGRAPSQVSGAAPRRGPTEELQSEPSGWQEGRANLGSEGRGSGRLSRVVVQVLQG